MSIEKQGKTEKKIFRERERERGERERGGKTGSLGKKKGRKECFLVYKCLKRT